MNILITAGNTVVPIDQVRCLTNIFTGRTGASIARCGQERGHRITLLTSHPETIEQRGDLSPHLTVLTYTTFTDLRERMEQEIRGSTLDAIIHCAAVSDYQFAGVFAPAVHTRFQAQEGTWRAEGDAVPTLLDRAQNKVKSDEPELWIRLTRAPKLIDLVRSDWGYSGILVKFKLEVSIADEQLLDIAERSRQHSRADLMVANTLEGAGAYAFLGPVNGNYQRVERGDLPARLLDAVETIKRG